MSLDRPLFIIGAARSGTTLLGAMLAKHPDVAYWIEPKYVWRYGNAAAAHDVRTAAEATPSVVAYIEGRFDQFVREQGKTRFVEKTPSNCFRIEFMHAAFPQGRFVHILRDGRDVALSAVTEWQAPPTRSRLLERLRRGDLPLAELRHYFKPLLIAGARNFLRPRQLPIWGPRFPGIEDVVRSNDLLSTCAIQWARSVEASLAGLAQVPVAHVLNVRYAALVDRPENELRRILRFADLAEVGISEAVQVVAHKGGGSTRRERLSATQRARLDELCGAMNLRQSTLSAMGA